MGKGELPKGWEVKKLGDLCNLMTGGTPSRSKPEYFINGNIKWLVSGDIHKGEIFDCEGRITEEAMANSNTKFLPVNSVMIALNGQGKTRGTVAILRAKATCNQSLVSIHPKDLKIVLPEYIFCNLHGRYEEIRKITGDDDNDRRGLNMPLIRNIAIPHPPLPEQQRIVAILDEAFATIAKAKANAEQNLKNAREVFDCVLNSILYSKKWVIKELGEVCIKVEYGSSNKSKTNGKLPVLRMGNIQNSHFTWGNLVYSDNEEDNKQYLLKHNDVLFNRTNSPELVGKTAIYKSEMPTIFAGYLIRIHRKEDLLDADYLNYYLNSKMAKDYGKKVVISSVNQANINGTKLKTYPIPLPPLKVQQAIVQKLDALSDETKKLEAIYQRKIDDLEELRKAVLQKAFLGQLKIEN